MRNIASDQALARVTDRLLTAAATLNDTGLGALGDDLGAVARVLAGESHLRRLLTETTISADDRVAMFARLLAGKIGTPAAEVVDATVRQGWPAGTDLVEGLRRLGRTALFLRAERAGELDQVEDELFRFGRIVEAAPSLLRVLDDPDTDPHGRATLVDRLLGGKAHSLTGDLLTSLARDPGGRSFSHGISELVEQAAARKDKLVAVVQSAIALSTEQSARLTVALRRIYARDIAVHVVVDPQVRGGMRIRVGAEVIDGSVAGRLAALRQALAS